MNGIFVGLGYSRCKVWPAFNNTLPYALKALQRFCTLPMGRLSGFSHKGGLYHLIFLNREGHGKTYGVEGEEIFGLFDLDCCNAASDKI